MQLSDFSSVTTEDILEKQSQESLWIFYFGELNLSKKYSNPLRDDGKPDCTFDYGKSNDLLLSDWAKGKFYSIWDFVGEKYSLSFKETIRKIALDHNIVVSKSSSDLFLASAKEKEVLRVKKLKKYNRLKNIRILPINPKDNHFEFWSTLDYKFLKNDFKRFKILPITKYYLDFENFTSTVKVDKIGFCYFISTKERQVYMPFTEQANKFRQIIQGGIIGLNDLVKGEPVIVTKSYKDMTILKLAGFNVCCILSERYKPTTQDLMILSSFGKVYTLFDNDETGISASKIWAETFFTTPLLLDVKDPYIFYKKWGLNKLKIEINEKINIK